MTDTQGMSSPRMTGDQRREQILAVARHVFAEGGYSASTDDIARAAGVSQPYVVRLFGSKRVLYAETYRRAATQLLDAFAEVPAGAEAGDLMGDVYLQLIADRDLRLIIMQGFMSSDPDIQAVARHTLGEAFRLHVEKVGAGDAAARDFVAHGMLINALLGTDAPAHSGGDSGLEALVACAVPTAERREAR